MLILLAQSPITGKYRILMFYLLLSSTYFKIFVFLTVSRFIVILNMYYKQKLLILLAFTLPIQIIVASHLLFLKYRVIYSFYLQAIVGIPVTLLVKGFCILFVLCDNLL